MIDKIISHYKILEKLGQGGMGTVYKAEDLTLGREVALKFISFDMSADITMKKRLKREAKACASINHPNITTIYEFAEFQGQNFIVMEYVEGSDLSELLHESTIDIGKTIEIALQALDALNVAHKKGFIHRDLKPANLMLDASDRVKIMDFGLAKPMSGSFMTQHAMTQSGVSLGTVAYMSPEQVKGEELDQRSDIYSMAVVLYHLLTGSLPFKCMQQYAMTYSIVNENPISPRELNPAIPIGLEEIILKAMAKNPEERFKDSAEMRDSLLHLQDPSRDSGAILATGSNGIPPMKTSHREISEEMPSMPTIAATRLRLQNKKMLKYIIPICIILFALVIVIVERDIIFRQSGASMKENSAQAHVDNAISFLRENKLTLAQSEVEQALLIDSTYAVAWRTMAAIHIQNKEYDLAVLCGEKSITLNENDSFAYYNLAYALEEQGKFDDAIQAYSNAVRIDSTFIEAYSAMGHAFLELNKPNDALVILHKGEKIVPHSDKIFLIYKNLGRAYYILRQYNEAIDFFKLSIERQPFEVPETIYYLALTYGAAGLKNDSIDTWRHYISVESDTAKQREAITHLRELQ